MPFDPSITQKVRSALMDAGHPDLVVEQIAGNFRELETRVEVLERDVRVLHTAERNRVTDTGVNRILDARVGKAAVNWSTWGIRAAVLAAVSLLARLAWKGLHAP